MIEAVTFDYWNTLCYEPDFDQRRELVSDAVVEVLTEAGVPVERTAVTAAYDEARGAYWEAWHANRQFTGTDAADLVVRRVLGEGAGGSELGRRLVDVFHGCSEHSEVRLVDGVEGAVAALKSSGIRLGIVCDVGLMASSYLRTHLDRHGLLGAFDHWSFSDEVGVYKPDVRIFEHALEGLGRVEPARAAHIGDRRRTDVAGAQGMGMRAVRITTVYDDMDPEQGPSGDAVISSYDELLGVLPVGSG